MLRGGFSGGLTELRSELKPSWGGLIVKKRKHRPSYQKTCRRQTFSWGPGPGGEKRKATSDIKCTFPVFRPIGFWSKGRKKGRRLPPDSL